MSTLNPAEKLELSRLLSSSLIKENLYNQIKKWRDSAYRQVLSSRGAEELFRNQGRLGTFDEVLRIYEELAGE